MKSKFGECDKFEESRDATNRICNLSLRDTQAMNSVRSGETSGDDTQHNEELCGRTIRVA